MPHIIMFLNLKQIEAITDYFPFEIDEDKRNDAIILTRTLKGEEIFVRVAMRGDEETENESTSSSLDDNSKEEGETDAWRSKMSVVVNFSKGDGSSLEFACSGFPEKIEIFTMIMEPPTTKVNEDGNHVLATYDGFE
jgi:complement component 1 Q subcomponent-binding protein